MLKLAQLLPLAASGPTEAPTEEIARLSARIRHLSGTTNRPGMAHRLLDPTGYVEAVARWRLAHPEESAEITRLEVDLELAEGERIRLAAQAQADEAEREALEAVERVAPRLAALVVGEMLPTKATAAVERFAQDKNLWCLLLLGGVGTGKSAAACRLAYETELTARRTARQRQPSFGWARASEASRLSSFGEAADARLLAWRTTGLFVLDDLGTELLTPGWQQALEDVLDERYQHARKTVLTSNLSPDAFKARYGERIADRVRLGGLVVAVDEASMRRAPK